MKHHLGIALAAAAVLTGSGVALAQGGPPPETPPVEAPPADPHEDTPLGPPTSLPPVEVEDTTTTTPPEVEEPESEEPEAPAEATENHGAVVSQAAHECPHGPGGVHGQCVSEVARDHDQDGTPDHGPGSPEHAGRGGNGGGNGRGGGD